jgi:hypothetical protein
VVERLDQAIISPAKRYSFAIDCLVDEWILRSYIEICSTVEGPSSELFAEFSRRNETNKLASLLLIREDYRTKLIIYTHGTRNLPYPSPSNNQTNPTANCTNQNSTCLATIKQLLLRILTTGGVSDLNGADPNQLPLLEHRLLKGIQPRPQNSLSLCSNCRSNDKTIVPLMLGISDLTSEIKKVMHLT